MSPLISGGLDYTTAGELRELITTLTLRPGQRLVLDLPSLEFCDSSGITALIFARNHVHADHAGIALAAVPDPTLRVLRIIWPRPDLPPPPRRQRRDTALTRGVRCPDGRAPDVSAVCALGSWVRDGCAKPPH
jgi:anti-anti-sigma factor